MDTDKLKETWSEVTRHGDDVASYFYAHLFVAHPELREMFPLSMSAQRDRLVAALGRIVSNVDELGEVVPYIEQLGRDHRRFTVIAEHYDAVGASLLWTLKHFLGPAWTTDVARDWAQAYGIIAGAMVGAAEQSADTQPAWWEAEVTEVSRVSREVAIVRLRPRRTPRLRRGSVGRREHRVRATRVAVLHTREPAPTRRRDRAARRPRAGGHDEHAVRLPRARRRQGEARRTGRDRARDRRRRRPGPAHGGGQHRHRTVPCDPRRDRARVAAGSHPAPGTPPARHPLRVEPLRPPAARRRSHASRGSRTTRWCPTTRPSPDCGVSWAISPHGSRCPASTTPWCADRR